MSELIQINLSRDEYEQDIRPLVRAFYPRAELMVTGNPQAPSWRGDGLRPDFLLEVSHDSDQIEVKMSRGDELLGEESYSFPEPEPDRHLYKNRLKKTLYKVLSGVTGLILPWGTLTGIRPTKIAYSRMIEVAADPLADAAEYLKEQYWCSDRKAALAARIAARERELLEKMDYRNGYSIYIGIPFCPTTCLYCSFASYPVKKYEAQVEPYLDALFREIEYAKEVFPNKKLTTLYIGGGTPTALNERQLDRLLCHIVKNLPAASAMEFTVEAGRPDSITAEKLRLLKEYGVTRISINPQTMVQRTLDLIGRKHTVGQVEEAFEAARREGHTNINLDLIIGLPGEHPEDVEFTLDRIKPLAPESLTIHALAVKRAASLKLKLDELEPPVPGEGSRMQLLTEQFAAEQGYEPYYLYRQKNITENLENTGYAMPGMEGLYNILIMEEKQTILALGAAGSSKFVFRGGERIERVENVKNVTEYITRSEEMLARKRSFLEKEWGSL